MQSLKAKLSSFGHECLRIYKLAGLYFLKFFHKHYLLIMMLAVTGVMLAAEYLVITYPTNDLVGIIFGWVNKIKAAGFKSFWSIDADYSPIFLFLCAIVSLLPPGKTVNVNNYTYSLNYIYYFKSIYYLCIIGMAIGVYLIIRKLTDSKWKAAVGYITTIVLPTVFMNSAIWGNCDSTLGLTLVFCIYFALTKHDRLAFLMFGLSMGNKLQAVFILPFLIYLLLNRKLKLYTIIYALIGFCLTFVPSWICGAPFLQPFSYVGVQLGRWNNLTYGCANMWHLINFRGTVVAKGATWIGLALVGALLAAVHLRRIDLSDKKNLFKVAILSIMAMTFFLPHMHERYFYYVEVLAVAYAFIDKKQWYLVPLLQVSGGIAYYHYLSGVYFIQSWGEDSVHIAAFINLFVLMVMVYDVAKLPHKNSFKEDIETFDEEIKELKASKPQKEEPVEGKNK